MRLIDEKGKAFCLCRKAHLSVKNSYAKEVSAFLRK